MATAKQKAEAEAKANEQKTESEMAKFELVRGGRLRQPSTGINIIQGSVKELKDDAWVQLQEEAGLLKRK